MCKKGGDFDPYRLLKYLLLVPLENSGGVCWGWGFFFFFLKFEQFLSNYVADG